MKWLLVLAIFGGPNAGITVSSIEFNSEQACQKAKAVWHFKTMSYNKGNRTNYAGQAVVIAECHGKGTN